ncbi:MAG: DUF393 domain-containing protein [Pseudomonadota bacterium]
MTGTPDIEVFYDGECPICRFEVKLYRRIDEATRIRWTDIGDLEIADLPKDKSRDELLGRFHVRDIRYGAQSDWFIGVDAFARIWTVLPGFRHFAFLFEVPGIRQLAMGGYRVFLAWQKWHRSRRAHA